MLSRRAALLCPAAAWLAHSLPARASAVLTLPLWPGMPPGGGGPTGAPIINAKGAVSHIAQPTLALHRPVHGPAGGNGAVVLIAGGGGYKRIENHLESDTAAAWLNARGITAAVLTYRLPGEGWSAGPHAPVQDALRAIRLLRTHAKDWAIDTGRIGLLGFSAGGHLMGITAVAPELGAYPPVDAADQAPVSIHALALAYPVLTLMPPYDHTWTRRMMIGEHPSAAASADWSVQTHVRHGDAATFLVQAQDDPISNPQNTVLMAEACRRAGVPVELHQPKTGKHGFAMGRPGTATMAWPGWYAAWLKRQGMLAG